MNKNVELEDRVWKLEERVEELRAEKRAIEAHWEDEMIDRMRAQDHVQDLEE